MDGRGALVVGKGALVVPLGGWVVGVATGGAVVGNGVG